MQQLGLMKASVLAGHELNMNCLELSKGAAYYIQEDLKRFFQIAREAFQLERFKVNSCSAAREQTY